jgi:hypothetical protein
VRNGRMGQLPTFASMARRAAHRQGYTLGDICRTVITAVGLVADDVRIWWLPYRADVTTPWIAAHCGGLGLVWVIRNP